jgi:predicted CoA-binding protein
MDPHEEELRQAKIDIVWLLARSEFVTMNNKQMIERFAQIARRMKYLLGRLEAAEQAARNLAHAAGMKALKEGCGHD